MQKQCKNMHAHAFVTGVNQTKWVSLDQREKLYGFHRERQRPQNSNTSVYYIDFSTMANEGQVRKTASLCVCICNPISNVWFFFKLFSELKVAAHDL